MSEETSRLLTSTPGPSSVRRPMFTAGTSYGSYTSIGDLTPRHLTTIPENRTAASVNMGRKMSRIRSNSVSILNLAGDDVIATSFGPVILPESEHRDRDWMLGWFLAIISGILFTANNFFVKYLNVDALEMLLIRSGLQTVLIMVGLISTRTAFLPETIKDRCLVILQGVLSGGRVFLQFACLSFMPLGDALTLVFTEPLWTIILSKLILKIDIGWWKSLFGLFLITGMVLTIQPPFIFNAGGASQPVVNTTEITTTSPFQNASYSTTESIYSVPTTVLPTINVTNFLPTKRGSTTKHPTNPSSTTTSLPTDPTSIDDLSTNAPTTQTSSTSDLPMNPTSSIPSKDNHTHYKVFEKIVEITGLKDLKQYLNSKSRESRTVKRMAVSSDDDGGAQGYGDAYYIGVLLALSTAVTGALTNVVIAKVEGASSSLMVFYSGLGGVFLALGFSCLDPNNRIIFNIAAIEVDEWLFLLMLGGSGLLGYYSMTRSLRLIPPTTVAVLRALEIILAYIAQAAIMGEMPNALAISGSSIVMFSVIGFALEETILSCYNCY